MSKLVILKLDGDLEQHGFRVTLEIGKENARPNLEIRGSLPASPDLVNSLNHWQNKYWSLATNNRIKPKEIIYSGSIKRQINECNKSAKELSDRLQAWLDSPEFRCLNHTIREELNREERIRLLICTDHPQIQQLPWHLWDFFQKFSKAEFAFSATAFQKIENPATKAKVKILAILGNSNGIDVKKDRELLENLPDAETVFLVEPQRNELNNKLWEQQWHILFFAGHSETNGEIGKIYLNQQDSLTIEELKFGLASAIARGLQLAIFNSCDGLGLARQFAGLNIPQIIVMREPVPDLVAQEFLKHFLVAYATGNSLYLALRQAREQLQGLEDNFPNATWLPVIFQNLGVIPPTWLELVGSRVKNDCTLTQSSQPQQRHRKPHLLSVLLASVVVTASLIGVRHLGILQGWELQAYDRLMQSRPEEELDPRLLVVGITEEDFQIPEQKERKGSLSDLALARVLEKLESYQPRAIGLDIFHDFPVDAQQTGLKTRLHQNNNFFAICQVAEPGGKDSGIGYPPDVPKERLGFSNVVVDADGILRRHLLSMDIPATSVCQAPISLSLQLALQYLKAEGITPKITPGNWQLGNVVFRRLQSPTGGYQIADTWGNQVLLNYRSYHSPLEIADTVTLKDVLTNKVPPEMVQNRIVLIGAIARTSGDKFSTPYSIGQSFYQQMPGVIVHAQMVSQILSAVLDGRRLIGVWSFWGEVVWVWGWAVAGGLLAWRFQSRQLLVLLAEGVAVGVLYGLCFWLLIQGNWVPLVPPALALVVTGVSVLVLPPPLQ